jgi:hypothetical protein
MGGASLPGPLSGYRLGSDWIDDGTMCRARAPAPGPLIWASQAAAPDTGPADQTWYYSPAFKVAVHVPFAIAPGMTWDAFWRLIYDHTNEALQKPAKSFEQFVAQKGSIEAVLRSVGKTRAVVDKIGVVSRVAGPASIVLEISLTAIVIQQAAPQDRGRMAAREIGGAAGSTGGGLGVGWIGRKAGEAAGEGLYDIYDEVSEFRWTSP